MKTMATGAMGTLGKLAQTSMTFLFRAVLNRAQHKCERQKPL
jgi:hypothetical protein